MSAMPRISGVGDPRDRLDERLARGRVKPRHVRAVAKELARLHSEAAAAERGGEPARLLGASRDQLRALRERGCLSEAEQRVIEKRVHDWLTHDVRTLLARHGSGHATGHVLQIPGHLPLAAIEVRGRRARIQRPDPEPPGAPGMGADVAAELASISSRLRTAGHDELAELLLAAYALAADDYALYRVIDAYETLSAIAHSAAADEPAEARARIAPWVGAFIAPTKRLAAPALILTVGGVASGKSTLAKRLVRKLAAPRVVADRVRAAILDPVAERAGPLAVLERAWSESFDERALTATLLRAKDVLESGRPCIVDSCSPFRRYRDRWARLAEETGARFVQCTCVASPARIRERLEARDLRDGVAAGDWSEIARRLEAPFEPVADEEAGRHLRVDTDGPLEASVTRVVEVLRPAARPAGRALRPGWPAAVTFDCWGTLVQERNWPVAHGLRVDALAAAVREDGAELERETVSAAFDVAWRRHIDLWRSGVASGAREVARFSLEELDLPLRDLVIEHLTERFQSASHSSEVEALEGCRDTLWALVEAGVRLAVICDTGLTPGRVVRQHLERFRLLEFFSAEMFSDEVGVPKPDSRIFQAALDAVEVRPGDAVHVGDLRRTDIAGARAMGMGSVRLAAVHDDTDDAHPEAEHVADSYATLLPMLGTWASRDPADASG